LDADVLDALLVLSHSLSFFLSFSTSLSTAQTLHARKTRNSKISRLYLDTRNCTPSKQELRFNIEGDMVTVAQRKIEIGFIVRPVFALRPSA
jgi:hypothetical protein